MPIETQSTPLITVEGLVTEFRTEGGLVRAVNGIDFTIPRVAQEAADDLVGALDGFDHVRQHGSRRFILGRQAL